MQVVGAGDGAELLGPGALQALVQPAGVSALLRRGLVDHGQQRLAVTLHAAQYRVEQALGPGFVEADGGVDGFADGGVRRHAQVQQLVQTDQQQRVQILVARLHGLVE